MKKRRRIEITAFRRQTAVVHGDKPKTGSGDPLRRSEGSLLTGIGAPQLQKGDFAEDQLISIDVARSTELALLVKALIESEGKTGIAAQQLGLSRSSFYSKLRRLGLSIKRVKTRLNILRHGRDRERRA